MSNTHVQFTLVELLRAAVHRLAEHQHQVTTTPVLAMLHDIGPLMLEAIKALSAPQGDADGLMTPAEYQAALASELSDAEISSLITQSMQDAIAFRSPFFRVSLPQKAAERAKEMLVKWDVRSDKVAALFKSNRLVHLKVSPNIPALAVFLLGDVVVVAQDVKDARRTSILAAEAAPMTPMGSAFAGGLLAVGDARQVDSSEVLSVYMWGEDGGTTVTHTAAEWISGGWRGVIGPLEGSDLEARIRAALVHRPECDGVPCYCGEGGEVAGPEDKTRDDLVRLTNMIGDAAKEIGVLCEGRPALDFFPEVLAKTKADARLHSASLVNEACRQRNAMACVAAQLASDAGLHAGILVDEAGEPGFRTVVAIDLGLPPDGANQITFHMDERDPTKPWSGLPPYGGEWDGHSDTVKWARITSYLDSDHRATGISEAPVPLLNKVVTADDAGQGDRRLCDRRVACPCCIAALVAESANYKSLQETLANTTLHCFRRMQP